MNIELRKYLCYANKTLVHSGFDFAQSVLGHFVVRGRQGYICG